MKLAKVDGNKILGIVEVSSADERLNEDGALIYRPVVEMLPQIDDAKQALGKPTYTIEDARVIESREVLVLNDDQQESIKQFALIRDAEFPSIEARLSALEAASQDPAVQANVKKLNELKAKYGVK